MRTGGWRIFALGCALWVVATAVQWPIGPSFRDEVGYIGQSRLELQGTMRPQADAVCYAFRTDRGDVAEYPPFIPTILIPLVAFAPRAAFAMGVVSALLLAIATGRALARWGTSPVLGLAVLLHPTVILLSRTAMGDLLLAATAVCAWNAVAGSRRWRTAAWFGLLVAVKPTGILLAAGLIGGTWIARRTAPSDREPARLSEAALGAGAGLLVAVLLNLAAVGGPQYATVLSEARFGASFVATSGWRHLVTFLVLPPGLVLGVWPLWKRREWGALAAAAALLASMAFYYFVDSGRTPLESLVLAPRLIVPAAAIVLVGWLQLAVRWWPARLRALGAALLLAGCVLAPAGLGFLHRRWQEPMRVALAGAEAQLALRHSRLLGVTESAFKAGVMARASIVAVTSGVPGTVDVVLCSAGSESYRRDAPGAACAFDGFELAAANGPYRILVRTR